MSNRVRILAIAGIAILGLGALGWWLKTPAPPGILTVERSDYREAVHAQGVIDTLNFFPLKAPDARNGRRLVYLFPEGQPIKQGEVVVRFDSSELEQQIEDQQDQISLHETTIEEKRTLWSTRYERLDNMILTRTEESKMADINLASRQFDSQLKQDEEQVRHNAVRRDLQSYEKLRQRYDFWRDGEIRRWQTEIDKCRRRIESRERLLEEYVIVAPYETIARYPALWIKAKRTWRQPEPGDELVRNQVFGQLPDYDSKCLNLYVAERDIERIAIGTDVEFTTDSYPDRPLRGKVTSKATVADSKASLPGRPMYLVQVDITEASEGKSWLIPGANVAADIILASHPDVFALPKDVIDSMQDKLDLVTDEGKPLKLDPEALASVSDHYLLPAHGHAQVTLQLSAEVAP